MEKAIKAFCNNNFAKSNIFYNVATGKSYNMKCISYSCPAHNWKPKARLVKGLTKWLKSFGYVRFWTFTVNSSLFKSSSVFNKQFLKIWHRFITELRRNKLIPKLLRNVQYVKVYEYHKSGCLHIHAFLSQYISQYRLLELWEYAIEKVINYNDSTDIDFPSHKIKLGNVYVKGMRNAKTGANYVAKYALKMAEEGKRRVNLWSSSCKVSLFPKFPKQNNLMLVERNSFEFGKLKAWHTLLVSKITDITNIYDLNAILNHELADKYIFYETKDEQKANLRDKKEFLTQKHITINKNAIGSNTPMHDYILNLQP